MKRAIFATLLCLIAGGCVAPIDVPPVADVTAIQVDPSLVNPIAIERVVFQVPRGQQIGTVRGGIACLPWVKLNAGGSQATITDAGYLDAIQHELVAAGYRITTSPNELFQTGAASATRLRLAGRVTDIKANVCFPMSGFGDSSNGTAEVFVAIEWQAFDSASKSVVMRVATTGYGTVTQNGPGPFGEANDSAAAMATRRLTITPEFQRLVKPTR